MVYVFGIDGVPLFEMMFIIMFLMLGGLIFIFLELKRLRELLRTEKSEIQRFEDDLSKFEKPKPRQEPGEDIINHVKEAKMNGIPDQKIQQSMMGQGWDKGHVDAIFKKL